MTGYSIAWTEKVELSKRVQDPLGLYVLKYLEDYFLPGITTQTARLRYYSFLTWVWNEVRAKHLDWSCVLDAEKVLTLASALHHINDSDFPRGIRNRGDANDFLGSKESIHLDKFVKFGVGGRNNVGYGNYYYTGPLSTLRVMWRGDQNEIVISPLGEAIAASFISDDAGGLFFRKSFRRTDLGKLSRACLCARNMTQSEGDLWDKVFFGFTVGDQDGQISVDQDSYRNFLNGDMKINSELFSVTARVSEEDYWRTNATSGPAFTLDHDAKEYEHKKSLRCFTLFLLMVIIKIARPEPDQRALNQAVRDAIYYQATLGKHGKIVCLNFGRLEPLRALWEVYVHNLYFISAFEYMFDLLLRELEKKPFGQPLSDIERMDEEHFLELLNQWIRIPTMSTMISNIESHVQKTFTNGRSTLSSKVNERTVFLALQAATEPEEIIAASIALLLLLKSRFNSFTQHQMTVLSSVENFSLKPDIFYAKVSTVSVKQLISIMFEELKSRHRFVSTIKYSRFGTKSWLFTEEQGMLYHYGHRYSLQPYRENKWWNCVEILHDLSFISFDENRVSLTQEGEDWLKKIA